MSKEVCYVDVDYEEELGKWSAAAYSPDDCFVFELSAFKDLVITQAERFAVFLDVPLFVCDEEWILPNADVF